MYGYCEWEGEQSAERAILRGSVMIPAQDDTLLSSDELLLCSPLKKTNWKPDGKVAFRCSPYGQSPG